MRTVATWHQKSDITPKSEMQQVLDAALERAPEAVRARFNRLIEAQGDLPPDISESAQVLRVAIAVVVREDEVLLVCRRGPDGEGIAWQFPAGMVKPGVTPGTVAVRETLAETGVHCAARRSLGSRLHPVTSVYCDYLLCEYLTGEAHNTDVAENVSVVWAEKKRLTRFIPAEQIFPPILKALEVDSDPDDA
ncbi:NUDIX hydrolase [Haloechinothrix aidingensis]|uniref:NUDIX hydrolase n=1 Tax=Haloechinothrix aidingensis TaxID=2752311 RepID=UPI001C6090D2